MTTEAGVEQFRWFLGIDWATAAHQLTLIDQNGEVVDERVVAHERAAIEAYLAWLERQLGGHFERLGVGIEVPRGAVVEILLERGAAVFSINPKQVDRLRDRISLAGAKDDRRDAWVIGTALRTDRGLFRRIAAEDPRIIQLRELARADEDLMQEATRLTHRLREQVYRIAANWLVLSPSADDPWFWSLLEQAATPARARQLRRRTIERLLRTHRIRRVSADEVLAVLRAPTLPVADGALPAAARHIALLLPRLRLVAEQRRACAQEMETLLTALDQDGPTNGGISGETLRPSDVAIVRSVPGVGRMVAATLLAEATASVAARDYKALRALGGSAPVTKQSGKHRTVSMRYACNPRLREAYFHWARSSVLHDAAAKAYYAALRARGHSHGRALRSVADRWLRILTAMLMTGTLYDPKERREPATLQPLPA